MRYIDIIETESGRMPAEPLPTSSKDSILIENDGSRYVIYEPGDVLPSPPPPDPNQAIFEQINALEAQQDRRRIREAALGIDNGWLENLENQIAALRGQLT